MSGERFTNARVHEWLTPDIDAVVEAMFTTRIQLNSAALWWFCTKLTAEERAEVLGEYVKVQALGGTPPPAASTAPATAAPAPNPAPRRGRPRKPTDNV